MNFTSSPLYTLLLWMLIVAALFITREVVIPLALAGILSFMLAPPVRLLQNLRVPRGLAVVVVVLAAFAAIFALGGVMARQVNQLAVELPHYQATISAKIKSVRGVETGGTLQRAQDVLESLEKELAAQQQRPAGSPPGELGAGHDGNTPIPVEVRQPNGGPLATLSSLISPLLGPLATTGIIIVFIIFILLQREDLRNRLIRLAGSTDIPHTTAAIDDAAHRLSHLFLTQLMINAGFGALVGLGLWQIGIPSAFLWGTLAGILRFIPYIGPVFGLVFPLILAVSVDPGWSMAIWTLVLFLVLEGITGQVIEPVVEGHSTGLSPVAVVVSATFWGWLWGPVGLVLATPLTVILVVLGRHVEALKSLDILFGDEPALSEAESFYQRMLARDPVEAVEQAKSFMAEHSLSDYCDRVARPGLIMAQKDFERGILEDDKGKVVRETIETLFDDIAHEHWLAKKEAHAAGIATTSKLPSIHREQLAPEWKAGGKLLAIGARSDLDEAGAAVIATLAQTHGIAARIGRPDELSAANIARLDLSDIALVCLSSVDIKTPAYIHYAARRLKSRAPHLKLLLGVWSAPDANSLAALTESANADGAAASFHEAAVAIIAEATGGAVVVAQDSVHQSDGATASAA